MKHYSIFIFLVFCFEIAFSQQYFDTLQLHKSLTFIAHDDKSGRYPGTEGSNIVAEFILQEFKAANLTPLCDNGYQYFSFFKGWTMGDSNTATLNEKYLTCLTDFAPLNYFNTINSSLSAQVVAIGNSKDIDWSLCTNKWVLIYTNSYSKNKDMAIYAIKQGVGGVILLDTNETFPTYKYYNGMRVKDKVVTTLGPVVQISPAIGNELLAKNNLNIDQLSKMIKDNPNLVLPLNTEFYARTNFIQKTITAKNVVALLEGSDPKLKDEYIVVGAHYDHEGTIERMSKKTGQLRTYIYNGADDNGSGTVGILELAKKISSQSNRPKRSIIFVAFDAEEEGLIGSEKFFDSCIAINPEQIKAMVNLDMIGRYNPKLKLSILGANSSKEGVKLIKKLTKKSDLKVDCTSKNLLFSGSDHVNFYKRNIPVFFFNTGTHKDYHRVSDEVEKIDFKNMQKILIIADDLINDLANRKKNLTFTNL